MAVKLPRTPRIAFVYDRVNTPFGGAENVLTALHQIFPDAPLFTSVYDPERAIWANSFTVMSSFLQSFPFAKQYHRQYVGFMPLAFESFELDDYDIVISITSAEAKGVLTKPHQLHICYLLTPTRYLWSHEAEYQQHFLVEVLKAPIFKYLKWWETAAALRPDVIIPISQVVADRCQRYYQRATDSVIYPPIELQTKPNLAESLPLNLVKAGFKAEEYYLVVSRLVAYKRIDLVIKSCAELGRPVVVIGDGPERTTLQNLANELAPQAKVCFIRAVQSTELTAYYKNCRAFLAPGEEDFGIASLEANLFGKPVVLHQKSGAAEISPDGVSSTHLTEQTVTALTNAIVKTEQHHWQKQKIQRQVAPYRTAAFQQQFRDRVLELWQSFQRQRVLD